MKKHLDAFIDAGMVRRNTKQNFILLKELVTFVREYDLKTRVKDINKLLTENGWVQKRMSVATEGGYQSKVVWVNDNAHVEYTNNSVVTDEVRRTLDEEELAEALRMIDVIYEEYPNIEPIEEVVLDLESNTLMFSNNGLKEILTTLNTIGRPERISSIIRSKSELMLMGELFYGTSSRTTLFKNYYKYTKE